MSVPGRVVHGLDRSKTCVSNRSGKLARDGSRPFLLREREMSR